MERVRAPLLAKSLVIVPPHTLSTLLHIITTCLPSHLYVTVNQVLIKIAEVIYKHEDKDPQINDGSNNMRAVTAMLEWSLKHGKLQIFQTATFTQCVMQWMVYTKC